MDARPLNPFVYDQPVPPRDLIDREEEAGALLARAEGGHNSRLSSPRRFGKTSLLSKVMEDAERVGMATVYVDFYGVLTLGSVATRVDRAYARSLRGPLGRWYSGVRSTLRIRGRAGAAGVGGEVEIGPETDAERLLLDLLALPVRLYERHAKQVLVVFDEFQAVLQAGNQIDALIRSEIQHHGERASYIFAGSHPGLMAELFGEKGRPFYDQAGPVLLDRLASDDLAEYVAGRFEQGGRDIGEALDPFLDLAAGHPQRAMLIAHRLWEATGPGGKADGETWAAALEALGREVQEELERTWDRLSSTEQRVLAAVAWGEEGLYGRRARDLFGVRKGAATKSAVGRLLDSAELERDPGAPTGLRIVDPLFALWIAEGRSWPA